MDAIVFDFDGTLVDTEPIHEEALRRACAPHDVPIAENETIGLSDEDAIAEAFARAGKPIDDDLLAALCRNKTDAYTALIDDAHIHVYDGALDLVRAAAARVPVAICTAAVLAEVRPVLARLDIDDAIAHTIAADHVEAKKPHPAAYRLAAKRLALDPARCVAIEDSPRGVASARAAGCAVVAVGHTTPADRLAAADRFVAAIADLTIDELLSLRAAAGR